jgi:formylglycine-generating enzyme required for sulfatase activity
MLTDRFQAAKALARERFDRRHVLLLLFGLLVLFVLVALVVFPPVDAPISDAQALRTLDAAQTIEPTAEPTEPAEASAAETEAPQMVVVLESTPTPETANDLTETIAPTPLPEAPAGMVTVAGGRYKMGATQGQFSGDETPPHFVTVSPFYIDTVEVTVGQFARFASGSGYKTSAERNGASSWRDFNTTDRQRQPVRRVSWADATRYCAWVGKRLPTEAEWELAAKGRSDRLYPWGNSFDGRANTKEYGANQPLDTASLGNRSPYGAYDMVGNVWEWVADWYSGNYYANSPSSNPRGPASGSERVIRGGSYNSRAERATTTVRGKANPDGWSDDIGFRCAKDVPQSDG